MADSATNNASYYYLTHVFCYEQMFAFVFSAVMVAFCYKHKEYMLFPSSLFRWILILESMWSLLLGLKWCEWTPFHKLLVLNTDTSVGCRISAMVDHFFAFGLSYLAFLLVLSCYQLLWRAAVIPREAERVAIISFWVLTVAGSSVVLVAPLHKVPWCAVSEPAMVIGLKIVPEGIFFFGQILLLVPVLVATHRISKAIDTYGIRSPNSTSRPPSAREGRQSEREMDPDFQVTDEDMPVGRSSFRFSLFVNRDPGASVQNHSVIPGPPEPAWKHGQFIRMMGTLVTQMLVIGTSLIQESLTAVGTPVPPAISWMIWILMPLGTVIDALLLLAKLSFRDKVIFSVVSCCRRGQHRDVPQGYVRME